MRCKEMANSSETHWHKPHEGEHRLSVSLSVVLVIALQFLLPKHLSLGIQKYICLLEAALLVLLVTLTPRRIGRHHAPTRNLSIVLTSVMTVSNISSAIKLIDGLVQGSITDANMLLLSGGSIWMANVVIFSLWFWELDRGGPGARAEARKPVPDFLFPQMSSPEYCEKGWHPKFFDYLYISVTNASAFSPTDTAPLSRWAKILMMMQSLTSLVTVGLVIARAVNILK
jgi:uncharacterized membrane protein